MALLINVLTQNFELLSWMANSESGEAMNVYNNVQDRPPFNIETLDSSFHSYVDQPC